MTGVQFLLRLLQLGLFLGDLLLEDHLHFCLHLCKLGFMHDTLFVVPNCRVDLLEDGGVLDNAHAQEFLRSPVLIENVIGVLPKLLHVGADEHLAELDEVAVLLIVDLNNTPRVSTATDLTTIGSRHDLVRANNSKWNLAGNLLGLCQRLLILVLVRGGLEYVNLVEGDIRENLSKIQYGFREGNMRRTNSGLEVGNFLISHRVSLGDYGNEVDACVQTRHELNINGSETYG